jgi:spore maturation protein CgeB
MVAGEALNLMAEKLLIVGNASPEHVGSHLYRAARTLGLEADIYDSRMAAEGPRWLRAACWRLGRRPMRLRRYEKGLLERRAATGATLVIATGIAPLTSRTLRELKRAGAAVFNYLTDDPWNPHQLAPWFLKALPYYDRVFSARRANLEDLRRAGVPSVSFLPFAYNPELHTLVPQPDENGDRSDVVFVGGADKDRLPFLSALGKAGFELHLYGGYWDRYPETRPYARGILPPTVVKNATGKAKVALCLVRRANRDGHCMRTFEIPAMSGCLLAESTEEHREIFGTEGAAALYFESIGEMLEKTRWLLDRPAERRRLTAAAHALITGGGHTYSDRLLQMLHHR